MAEPARPPLSADAGAQTIATIRALINAQKFSAAKQQLRHVQSRVDEPTWAMIVEIATTLRFKTHELALKNLRTLWANNEPYRPLIEACVPKTDDHQHVPETELAPVKSATAYRLAAPVNSAEAYDDELGKDERSDPGTLRAELIVDRRDYDEDAAAKVRFGLCVSCRLERAGMDHLTPRLVAGRGDDGLCGPCREDGRPCVPELPVGHSIRTAVAARMQYLAEHHPSPGLGIYRQEWRTAATPQARDAITSWVKAQGHKPALPSGSSSDPESADLNGRCVSCGENRQVRTKHDPTTDRDLNYCVDHYPGLDGKPVAAGTIGLDRTSRLLRADRAGISDAGSQGGDAKPGERPQQRPPAGAPQAGQPWVEKSRVRTDPSDRRRKTRRYPIAKSSGRRMV
ncbi:hypothetical protein [Nocardia sp. NPDC051832]|uniref:hypothetical protein n=1 Tax=Nocardia sp. NPDC051832 TaxID=3155673 RepID=UPI00342211E1